MSQKTVPAMVTFWNEYLDHHEGDETAASLRLDELMRMDMGGVMPDEIIDVNVSSVMDGDELERLRQNIREYRDDDDIEGDKPYRLVLGWVD